MFYFKHEREWRSIVIIKTTIKYSTGENHHHTDPIARYECSIKEMSTLVQKDRMDSTGVNTTRQHYNKYDDR